MNAYLHPRLAFENLLTANLLNELRRFRKDLAARQVREFTEACEQLQRLAWPAEAARELAALKVYGVVR